MTGEFVDSSEIGSFITNRFGDKYFYAVNRNAFDRVGADSVLSTRLGKRLLKEDTLHVVVGTDSGLILNYLARRGVPAGSRYLFVELPELLPLVEVEYAQFLADEPHVALTTVENWLEAATASSFAEYVYVGNVGLCQSVGAEDSYLADYVHLWRRVTQEYGKAYYHFRHRLGHRIYIERQLQNLGENRVPASLLADSFQGGTAIVLGAAPSINEVLPWVRDHREKLVVFAVSRICHRLPEAGIEPDFVVSVDPFQENFEFGKGMLRYWEGATFIHSNHVVPLLLSAWQGNSVYLDKRFPWQNDVEPPNPVSSGGETVANAAAAAAVAFGFSQVLLTGVDLCLSADHRVYASGGSEPIQKRMFNAATQQVETYSGRLAGTKDDYLMARDSLGRQAIIAREKHNCVMFNLSIEAARTPGIEYLPMDEVIFDDLLTPPREIVAKLLPPNNAESRLGHYRECLAEVARMREELKQISDLAEEALVCNDGLFGRNAMTADFSYKVRMDAIEDELNTQHKAVAILVKSFGLPAFAKCIRPDTNKEWSDEDIEAFGRRYYEAYRDTAAEFDKLLEVAEERLGVRVEEESTQPDVERMVKDWMAGQPGRAVVWQAWHPEVFAALSEADRERVEGGVRHYREQFENYSDYLKDFVKRTTSLSGIRAKALEHFHVGEVEELAELVHFLSEDEEAGNLLPFVAGLLAELRGNDEGALLQYRNIQDGSYLDDALRRSVNLLMRLERFEEAAEFLARLAELSIQFVPYLADLKVLSGEVQEGIDLYTKYLSKVPDDLHTMMKLATLYRRINLTEGVRVITEHVLKEDPENEAARRLYDEITSE